MVYELLSLSMASGSTLGSAARDRNGGDEVVARYCQLKVTVFPSGHLSVEGGAAIPLAKIEQRDILLRTLFRSGGANDVGRFRAVAIEAQVGEAGCGMSEDSCIEQQAALAALWGDVG